MALTARSNWRKPLAALVALSIWCLTSNTSAQTAATPQQPRQPRQTAPQPSRPATPQPTAPATKPAEQVKPPAPPPEDVRFKSIYTTGGQRTETVTFIKGQRERYEFQDMVLLKQHDQKRIVQISRAANTYLVAPEGMPVTPGAPAASPRPSGVIMVATTIVDTGERKAAFGQQARRVKMMIDKQPMPGACDASKQRVETDGWYIDAPVAVANQSAAAPEQAAPGDCSDQTQAAINGDPKALGFPIAYTTTITGNDGTLFVASMEVIEFQLTTLDATLFDIPPGLNAALNLRELSKALGDANEAKLAAADAAPAAAPTAKAPGVIRIGVPELTNKTTQTVDTRALRQRLIGDLAEAKFDAVPMVAASPAELQTRALELEYDYVLLAEVTELKASKPGKLGGLMSAASGIAGGSAGIAGAAAGAAGAPKENTESTIAVKLLQPDGKQRLSTTAKGKDGSGFTLKTGLGLAKFAGSMYLSMMAGPMMMYRLNSMGAANMGGMGMLGNPMLYRVQGAAGLSGLGRGMGMDPTAGAASFVIGTAMQMDDLGGYVGVPGQGPSYDESLGEAVQNAAKAVQKALEKK